EQNGDLPVNLHLVIEGEEEIGSVHLGSFLEGNRETLKSDVAVISDTMMIARRVPTLSYGLRGVTALEIKVTGPKLDLHSGVFGRDRPPRSMGSVAGIRGRGPRR